MPDGSSAGPAAGTGIDPGAAVRLERRLHGRRGTTVPGVQRGNTLAFGCPAHDEGVRCDFVGAEPLDVRLDAVCQTRALPARAAKPVMVRMSEHRPVTVDWVTMAWQPPGVRLVAARTIKPGDPVTLLVADDEDRFVRFSREGASPVTVPSRDLPAPGDGGYQEPFQVASSSFASSRRRSSRSATNSRGHGPCGSSRHGACLPSAAFPRVTTNSRPCSLAGSLDG